jgi:hypothetical protein
MSRTLRLASLLLLIVVSLARAQDLGPWPPEKANAWYEKTGWLVGANYGPANAINQLEMWQAETFDLKQIDKELGWAESLGFNSIRVFLHDKLWEQDSKGFLERMDKFLEVADRHKVGVMFVLFDAVWDPNPELGPQRQPRAHLHNSGWVQSPGHKILRDRSKHDSLKPYVVGVVGRFKDDKRVQVWDLFNEPDNVNRPAYIGYEPNNKMQLSTDLLRKTFQWAREAGATQPLTAGVWIGQWPDHEKLTMIEKLSLEQSDVISFHSYDNLDKLKQCVTNLKRYNRPILCTEYMARPNGSTFDPHLGWMKENKVAAYNWGFVQGKTQTIYPWDSWTRPYNAEPPVWFHDIFRTDGTPYRQEEVDYIKKTTGKK